jgi:hypothetical protein
MMVIVAVILVLFLAIAEICIALNVKIYWDYCKKSLILSYTDTISGFRKYKTLFKK